MRASGAHAAVPSPPISHASEAFPGSGGHRSAPSLRTAHKRPHGRPKGRSAARMPRIPDSLTAGRLGHRQSTHIPLQHPQQPQKGLCETHTGSTGHCPTRARPSLPKRVHPAGRRINRSVPGGPATTVSDGLRIQTTGRSQHRSPGGLDTHGPHARPHRQCRPARSRRLPRQG